MTYSWDLDTMRSMDLYDFHVHIQMCMAKWGIEREFNLNLAGVDTKNKPGMSRAELTKKIGRGQSATHEEHISINKVLTKEDL